MESRVRRGIFQCYFFVLASINTGILRKSTAGYDLAKDLRLTIFFFFMDDLKLFGKNEDQIDSSRVQTVQLLSEDIETAGVWVGKV